MIAIGSYFIFIMFVMGTICDDPKFSEEDERRFFFDILHEHNTYRLKHGSLYTYLSDEMSDSARTAVQKYVDEGYKEPQNFNYSQKPFITSSKLNETLAKEIVADWYNTGANYNYKEEPSSNTADPFTRILWNEMNRIGAAILWQENILYVVISYSGHTNTKEYKGYLRNVKKPLNVRGN